MLQVGAILQRIRQEPETPRAPISYDGRARKVGLGGTVCVTYTDGSDIFVADIGGGEHALFNREDFALWNSLAVPLPSDRSAPKCRDGFLSPDKYLVDGREVRIDDALSVISDEIAAAIRGRVPKSDRPQWWHDAVAAAVARTEPAKPEPTAWASGVFDVARVREPR
jgi:hypothetical protein